MNKTIFEKKMYTCIYIIYTRLSLQMPKTTLTLTNWSMALIPYTINPQHYSSTIYYDLNVVIIQDKHPKSLKHFLIMPRERIDRDQLTTKNIQLIQLLKQYANDLVDNKLGRLNDCPVPNKNNGLHNALIGFHAIPSMHQLHLHVLSRDLSLVRHKHHYNSFSSEFLMNPDTFIRLLKEHGRIKVHD